MFSAMSRSCSGDDGVTSSDCSECTSADYSFMVIERSTVGSSDVDDTYSIVASGVGEAYDITRRSLLVACDY